MTDSRALKQHKAIMHNLRTEEPLVTGVLVSTDKKYYVRMMEGHETTLDQLKERFSDNLDKLNKLLLNPGYQNFIRIGFFAPSLAFLGMALEIYLQLI